MFTKCFDRSMTLKQWMTNIIVAGMNNKQMEKLGFLLLLSCRIFLVSKWSKYTIPYLGCLETILIHINFVAASF